MEIDTDLLEKL